MNATSFLQTVLAFICYVTFGVLFGLQYVHYVEHKIKKIRYSYIRYVMTIFLILLLALAIAELGGFEKKHWLLDLLPIILIIMSVYFTVKYLFKKKNLSKRSLDKAKG